MRTLPIKELKRLRFRAVGRQVCTKIRAISHGQNPDSENGESGGHQGRVQEVFVIFGDGERCKKMGGHYVVYTVVDWEANEEKVDGIHQYIAPEV